MPLFPLFAVPPTISTSEFELVIAVEASLFLFTAIIALRGLALLRKRATIIRKLVLFFVITYTLTLLVLVVSKLLYFLTPISNPFYLTIEPGIGSYTIALNTIALVLFYFQVFENDPHRQKIKSLSVVAPLAIIIILFVIFPIIQSVLVFLVFIVAIVFFILLASNSKKLMLRLSEALDKSRMRYLYYMGIIMTISYICTLTFQTIASLNIGVSLYSYWRLIPALIGAMAMTLLFLAFFPPDRLAEKWVPDAELPPLDLDLQYCSWEDDFPKLSHEIVEQKRHSCEWWYFDAEDASIGAKFVFILKQCDTTTYPGYGGVQFEWTPPAGQKERKFYKKTAPQDFKFVNSEEEATITIDPSNQLTLMRANDYRLKAFRIEAQLGPVTLSMDATVNAPGIKFGPNGHYYQHRLYPDIYSGASLQAPKFSGTATVSIEGESVEMMVNGYHDHTFCTADFLDTHRQWYWARAYLGELFLMYGDVKPRRDYYGRMKYFYLIPGPGQEPRFEREFTISPSEFYKEKSLAFPHRLHIDVPKQQVELDLEFKQLLFDQAVYDRSIFAARLQGADLPEGSVDGDAFVEYYDMPDAFAFLARFMARKQYNTMLVHEGKNQPDGN